MLKNVSNSTVRKIDNSLSIIDLFNGKDFKFDVVIGELNGIHPKLINKISDRAYFVLEGSGKIQVDEKEYDVNKGDLVLIKAAQIHSLTGEMKYIIITSPPFDPQNEELV